MAALSVLFVCLGNICRSPLAEGILRDLASRDGCKAEIFIDSAGTGNWHVGDPPDARAIATAAGRGIDIAHLRARQVSAADFDRFDLILALDRSNLRSLEGAAPHGCRARIELFATRAFGAAADVPDPYFGDGDDFEAVFDLLYRGCTSILDAPIEGPASNKGNTSSVT